MHSTTIVTAWSDDEPLAGLPHFRHEARQPWQSQRREAADDEEDRPHRAARAVIARLARKQKKGEACLPLFCCSPI